MPDDYSDLDDEIRPHLAEYVRDVIATGRACYPEAFKLFCPQTLAFWRHREAFYVAMVRLYTLPETGQRWGLTPEEVAEYRRIRNDPHLTDFDDPLDDVELRCGPGWNGILRRMLDEISRADVKVQGIVAEERNGHLSIDYAHAEPWLAAARVFLLAEFRSYYVCEVCGQAGEHRGDGPIWRTTRCSEHKAAAPGRLIYDLVRTPWRRMSDGDWTYDVDTDVLKPRV